MEAHELQLVLGLVVIFICYTGVIFIAGCNYGGKQARKEAEEEIFVKINDN